MNNVNLIGRLTRDVELKTTPNGSYVCSFTLAVNRNFKNESGEYEADFINCVAWRERAEFLAKYFAKGNMMGVLGRLQSRSWDDQDGKKRFATEVIVSDITFVEKKKGGTTGPSAAAAEDQFDVVEDDDTLPF